MLSVKCCCSGQHNSVDFKDRAPYTDNATTGATTAPGRTELYLHTPNSYHWRSQTHCYVKNISCLLEKPCSLRRRQVRNMLCVYFQSISGRSLLSFTCRRHRVSCAMQPVRVASG
jgi:hypothetical protein